MRRLKFRYSHIKQFDMGYLRQCLKRARVCFGYSPAQLASAIGISRKTLVGLERNRRGGDYRPDRATTFQLVHFCKQPLPPRSTPGLKSAMKELDWVVTRIAAMYGWEEYKRDLHSRTRPVHHAEIPKPGHHLFILDDLYEYDDAALRTPIQVECDDLLAHIRLNTSPDALGYVESDRREALRAAIRQVRDKLDLTQSYMQEDHGVSRPTISRLENLDCKGATLPSRSTLLRLAAICHQEGRTEDRQGAGLPLDTEWHQLATVLEDAATWERKNKFAPRGKNRRYLNLGIDSQ